MSVIGTIATTVKQGSGDEVTYNTIIAAAYSCKQTSITVPYRLIARLDTDADYVAELAVSIVKGETLNLDMMMADDARITLDVDYLLARERETPELVRYDKNGNIRPCRTTPAAFVRRFIVPAVEFALDAAIIEYAGIDTDTITGKHLQNIIRTIARTEVTDKVRHTTDASNADKRARMSRRARRAAHK